MAVTGAFLRGAAVEPAAPPSLNARHGQRQQPDTAWSDPPAAPAQLSTVGDYDDAYDAPMSGRGVVRDLGHRYGHAGTDRTAYARRWWTGPESGRHAAEAAAMAHGDQRAEYITPHRYRPAPAPFAGESYSVDFAEGRPGKPLPVRGVVHSRPGGEFSDGTNGEVAPTGYRLGIGRRWAVAHYSSPMLGAMHSSHVARGVLPQVVAVPVNQPASGGVVFNSGLSSQQRWSPPAWITPRLFRSPPSTSDSALAEQQPASIAGPVI